MEKIFKIEDGVLIKCLDKDIMEATIPDGVTSIGPWAFDACSSLKKVYIPNSVTDIGVKAFNACEKLESIYIPDSVTRIGFKAFPDCSSLIMLHIPENYIQRLLGRFYPESVTDGEH